jgi:hypothetical protein
VITIGSKFNHCGFQPATAAGHVLRLISEPRCPASWTRECLRHHEIDLDGPRNAIVESDLGKPCAGLARGPGETCCRHDFFQLRVSAKDRRVQREVSVRRAWIYRNVEFRSSGPQVYRLRSNEDDGLGCFSSANNASSSARRAATYSTSTAATIA